MSAITTENNTMTAELNNPFPGLRPFRYEESHLFFGREGQIDEVLDKLITNKFVAVVGTSGIGKSSFMYCGLLPILYGDYPTEFASSWEICVCRPGVSPIKNLARALSKPTLEFASEAEDKEVIENVEYTTLSESSMGLVESIRNKYDKSKKNYLIFIDQFEEIFRFRQSDSNNIDEASAFVKLLMKAVHQEEVPVYVVLTMRSDFVGDCSQYPSLTRTINNSQFLIPQMTRAQKREAIMGPISVMGGQISERLIQQILNDVGDNPDQLPIMQHALMRTWDYWDRNRVGNESMDVAHYEAIGSMKKALSIHANEAYAELNERQKEVCEKLFKTITEKGEEGRGVRRPTKLRDVASISNATEDEVAEVVDHFRKPGRTLLMPPFNVALKSESIVDISHESLMRIWTMLQQWVEEEYESVKLYLRLAEAAEMHQLGKTGLWRPPDLQIATSWLEEQQPSKDWGVRYHPAYERTMLFLEFSKKEYEKEQIIREKLQKRRLLAARITAIVLGLGAVVAMMFFLYGEMQRKEAEKQRAEASKQKEVAEMQATIAKQESERAEVAAKEALEQSKIALEQSEIAKREAERAQVNEQMALKQTKLAQEERRNALEQMQIAQEAKGFAKSEEAKALRLRLVSIAKSMAIKSLQMQDSVQRGLVAQQAYQYNKNYGGRKYDPDIYDGMYYAAKNLEDKAFNSLIGHTENVRAIATGNNNIIYSAGSDGQIYKWKISDGAKNQTVIAPKSTFVHKTLAIDSKNQMLVAGGDYNFIRIYNLNDPSKPKDVKGNFTEVWWAQFAPNGKGIYVLTSDKRILLYDFNTYIEVATSDKKVNSIALSPDGTKIAAARNDGQVMIIDLQNNFKQQIFYQDLDRAKSDVISVVFSHNGRYLAAGNETGVVKLWDMKSGRKVATLYGHKARVNNIAFSNNDQRMATGSFDKTVRIWNMSNLNDQPIVLRDHNDWVWSIGFNSDGDKLLAGCRDYLIRVWPTDIESLAAIVCPKLKRNMSDTEWEKFVADDLPYEFTCPGKPKGENTKIEE